MEAATHQAQRFQWPCRVRFVVELGLLDRKKKKKQARIGRIEKGVLLMIHNPTYRFRDQGAELRAQTLERDHYYCSSKYDREQATRMRYS